MAEVSEPPAFLITGVMAAGKSTVAEALARRVDRGVHVRGDTFRRFVVAGRHEMSPDPSDEALRQLRLRYTLAASCVDTYAAAGFVTVLQDVVLGPLLPEVIAMIEWRPLAVVVLAPSVDALNAREAGRAKDAYGAFTPAEMDRAFRAETPQIGLWIDSTDLTVDQTVDAILKDLAVGLV